VSRKKQKRQETPVVDDISDVADIAAVADVADAVPDEVLAEGSGPVDSPPTIEELAAAMAEPIDDVVGDEAAEPVELAEAEAEAEAGDSVEGLEVVEGAEAAILPTSAVALDDATLKHLVEAIVFASDKPVTLQRLRQLTRIADVRRIEQALELLATDYAERGIALQQVSGGYQFRTNTAYSSWVQQLIAGRPVRLSRAQLETLAIVAYRQPITRPEIDEIRGVDSSATLRLLLDRSLIRVLGKREEVGRPMLYGTTGEFLDFFSLQDLRELPTLREYSELTAESRQVMSDRLGVSLDESEAAQASGASEPARVEPSEAETIEAAVEDTSYVEASDAHVDTTADDRVAEADRVAAADHDADPDADADADAAADADADDHDLAD
jgi:segregation and condensation protein B